MITKKHLNFLKSVGENNTRAWFDEHRDEYHIHKKSFMNFFDEFTSMAVMSDSNLTDSVWESHIFRINRDIRFSKNKDPYKPYMWGFICPGWKPNKNIRARYHIHIEPWNSFVGWWAHMPDKKHLDAIREVISQRWDELEAIITAPEFKKYYPGLTSWNTLKTAPKWFPRDHKYIEYLKRKSISAVCHISDKDILWENIENILQERIIALKPLNDWLNSIHI